MISRQVETLFCDDIRHETNGKAMYIGVYSSAMLVQQFPITLPKLCIAIKVTTPADQPFRSFSLRILKDDDVIQEVSIDEDQLAIPTELFGDVSENFMGLKCHTNNFLIALSQVKFDKACMLRVRVQTESEELAGLGLRIMQLPEISAGS